MLLNNNASLINDGDIDVHSIKQYSNGMDTSIDQQQVEIATRAVGEPLKKKALQQRSPAVASLPEENRNQEPESPQQIAQLEEGHKYILQSIKDLIRQIDKRFEATDKHFEAMDKRFEVMDKRIDDLRHEIFKHIELLTQQIKTYSEAMEKRFEATDKRIDDLRHEMFKYIELLAQQIKTYSEAMEKRFEATDKRIDDLRHEMLKNTEILAQQLKTHSDATNTRIDDLRHEMDKRLRAIYWVLGILILLTGSGFGFMINILFRIVDKL